MFCAILKLFLKFLTTFMTQFLDAFKHTGFDSKRPFETIFFYSNIESNYCLNHQSHCCQIQKFHSQGNANFCNKIVHFIHLHQKKHSPLYLDVFLLSRSFPHSTHQKIVKYFSARVSMPFFRRNIRKFN